MYCYIRRLIKSTSRYRTEYERTSMYCTRTQCTHFPPWFVTKYRYPFLATFTLLFPCTHVLIFSILLYCLSGYIYLRPCCGPDVEACSLPDMLHHQTCFLFQGHAITNIRLSAYIYYCFRPLLLFGAYLGSVKRSTVRGWVDCHAPGSSKPLLHY